MTNIEPDLPPNLSLPHSLPTDSLSSNTFKLRVQQIWLLIKTAFVGWQDDYAQSMGAALAYYTMFSIAPLVLIAISIAGLVFGEDAARGEIAGQLHRLLGEQGAMVVEALVQSVNKPTEGWVTTLIGIVLVMIGATSVFGELQNALDRIWQVTKKPEIDGFLYALQGSLLSFGMVLCVGLVLIASLILSAGLSALGKWWSPIFGGWETAAHLANIGLSFALTTFMFALIFKIMPRVRIEWHEVWVGASITAILFTLGQLLIGFYIGTSGVTSSFGAAGSLVALLVWVYYSAQVFLMGVELTKAYSYIFGSRKNLKNTKVAW